MVVGVQSEKPVFKVILQLPHIKTVGFVHLGCVQDANCFVMLLMETYICSSYWLEANHFGNLERSPGVSVISNFTGQDVVICDFAVLLVRKECSVLPSTLKTAKLSPVLATLF